MDIGDASDAGQGMRPRRYSPVVDQRSKDEIAGFLQHTNGDTQMRRCHANAFANCAGAWALKPRTFYFLAITRFSVIASNRFQKPCTKFIAFVATTKRLHIDIFRTHRRTARLTASNTDFESAYREGALADRGGEDNIFKFVHRHILVATDSICSEKAEQL